MTHELERIDAWWRAANYLSVGQIYLLDNPLLTEPLRAEHTKPRLLGHWGTTPGLNFVYAHLNRAILARDLNMLYVCGPGHGGPGMVANTWLEGSYTDRYPSITRDGDGMRKLFRQFSFPGGIPSHAAPNTPGSINEGGELGYSLAHAYGAAFDNPDLVVACVIGDGEAETGPLAASWHSNKFLDPVHDGAVLPILHLNGWKIANPTVLARIGDDELRALLEGSRVSPTSGPRSTRSPTRPPPVMRCSPPATPPWPRSSSQRAKTSRSRRKSVTFSQADAGAARGERRRTAGCRRGTLRPCRSGSERVGPWSLTTASKVERRMNYPIYTLPDLPYDPGALEPHIDGRIMELHRDKHHAAYVTGANTALEQLAESRTSGDFATIAKLEKDLAFRESSLGPRRDSGQGHDWLRGPTPAAQVGVRTSRRRDELLVEHAWFFEEGGPGRDHPSAQVRNRPDSRDEDVRGRLPVRWRSRNRPTEPTHPTGLE